MKKKRKILIIEDHSLNLKLFRDVLRAKGFETIEDRTGAHCLDLAKKHQPELIILDILLPFASGIDLAKTLQNDPKTAHIPLLGVTALAISSTHDKMIEAGCAECLTKPFTLDQFLKSADNALKTPPQTLTQPEKRQDKTVSPQDFVNFTDQNATKNAQNQNDLGISKTESGSKKEYATLF